MYIVQESSQKLYNIFSCYKGSKKLEANGFDKDSLQSQTEMKVMTCIFKGQVLSLLRWAMQICSICSPDLIVLYPDLESILLHK